MNGKTHVIKPKLRIIAWLMCMVTSYATIAFVELNSFDLDPLSKLLAVGVLAIATVLGGLSVLGVLAALETGRRDKDAPADKG